MHIPLAIRNKGGQQQPHQQWQKTCAAYEQTALWVPTRHAASVRY